MQKFLHIGAKLKTWIHKTIHGGQVIHTFFEYLCKCNFFTVDWLQLFAIESGRNCSFRRQMRKEILVNVRPDKQNGKGKKLPGCFAIRARARVNRACTKHHNRIQSAKHHVTLMTNDFLTEGEMKRGGDAKGGYHHQLRYSVSMC